MSKYCFKIYYNYNDLDEIVYVEADSKQAAIRTLREDYKGEISDYTYLGIE